jgi:hypothetical protein
MDDAEKAVAELEAIAAKWFEESGFSESVVTIMAQVRGPFKERSFDLLTRMMRQAYAEGFYEGTQVSGRK